jgi:HD superfamily phosphodiesterase
MKTKIVNTNTTDGNKPLYKIEIAIDWDNPLEELAIKHLADKLHCQDITMYVEIEKIGTFSYIGYTRE